MLFQGRIERAFKRQAELNKERRRQESDEITPADLVEKGDFAAMVIAGLITILPVALLVLLVMSLAGWLFMK